MSDDMLNQHALNVGNTFPWHEVYAKDAEAAIAFYTTCLDFGTQSMDMGPMGQYHMLTRNGQAIGGVMGTAAMEHGDQIPPHWAVYLAVDDVDARIAKCVEHGASVVVPAMDIPGVGRMALIADPQGAHLWLYKGE